MMYFSDFYSISAVVVTLGLLKLSLGPTGRRSLIVVFLGCALSFIAFENSLTFLPIACYLLKDKIQSFFLFLKNSFNNIKQWFLFTGNQTEKEDVGEGQALMMEKSGSETESLNPLPIEKSGLDSEKGEGEEGDGFVTLKLDKEHIKLAAGVGIDLLDTFAQATSTYLVVAQFIKYSFHHLTACKDSAKLRQFGSQNTIAIFLGAYLLLYSSRKIGGNFSKALDEKFREFIDGARPISEFPEKMEKAETFQKELEGLLNLPVLLKQTVSGELVVVTNEKTDEFVSWLAGQLSVMAKENGLDLSLIDANNLSSFEKELFSKPFKHATPEEIATLRNEHAEFFRSVTLLAKSFVDPQGLQEQLIVLNDQQNLIFREQQSEGATSPAPVVDPLEYPGLLARVKLRSLPYIDGATLSDIVTDIRNNPISPGFSYDQFYKGIEDVREEQTLAAEKALIVVREYHENLEKRADYYETLRRRSDEHDILAAKSAENGKNFESLTLGSISQEQEQEPLNNEGKPSPSKTSSTSENELPLPPTPPTPWSPLERGIVEKDRHSQWVNVGVGAGIVLAICRGCIDVVRRLDYTQKWVKEMTDKGFPRWLFFWVPDSNPETFPEKSLFSFLVRIFVLNLVILYVLFHFL